MNHGVSRLPLELDFEHRLAESSSLNRDTPRSEPTTESSSLHRDTPRSEPTTESSSLHRDTPRSEPTTESSSLHRDTPRSEPTTESRRDQLHNLSSNQIFHDLQTTCSECDAQDGVPSALLASTGHVTTLPVTVWVIQINVRFLQLSSYSVTRNQAFQLQSFYVQTSAQLECGRFCQLSAAYLSLSMLWRIWERARKCRYWCTKTRTYNHMRTHVQMTPAHTINIYTHIRMVHSYLQTVVRDQSSWSMDCRSRVWDTRHQALFVFQ